MKLIKITDEIFKKFHEAKKTFDKILKILDKLKKKILKTTLLWTSRSVRAQMKTVILVCKFLFRIRFLFVPLTLLLVHRSVVFKIFFINFFIYLFVMRFRKPWLKVQQVNFDFSAKLSSTVYNESKKPTLKYLAHIGSEKLLVELFHIFHSTEKFTFHPELWVM